MRIKLSTCDKVTDLAAVFFNTTKWMFLIVNGRNWGYTILIFEGKQYISKNMVFLSETVSKSQRFHSHMWKINKINGYSIVNLANKRQNNINGYFISILVWRRQNYQKVVFFDKKNQYHHTFTIVLCCKSIEWVDKL